MPRSCYCGSAFLADGTCRYKCDPAAKPSVLRAKANAERKARERARSAGERVGISQHRVAMSAAVAKFDPVVRHTRAQRMRATRKSHAPGAHR